MVEDGFMRTSIKDIAKRANLHPSTVGDILRDRPQCYASPATKKRVRQIAKELNYRPNMSARALKTQRSHLIGLIAYYAWEPHLTKLVTLLSQRLLEDEFTLEVHVSEETTNENGLRSAYARPADAVIDVASYSPSQSSYAAYLMDIGYPLISVLCHQEVQGDYVTVDRLHAMRDIVKHLVGLGHRRIACCTFHGPSDEKREGFLQATKHVGIDIPENYLPNVPGTFDEGYQFGGSISIGPDHPTVYVMHNDAAALGFIRAMADRNLKIPDDISVVGFNGNDAGAFSVPRLTTVEIPLEKIATATVKLVMERINNGSEALRNGDHQKIVLPGKLIVRESCGANKNLEI